MGLRENERRGNAYVRPLLSEWRDSQRNRRTACFMEPQGMRKRLQQHRRGDFWLGKGERSVEKEGPRDSESCSASREKGPHGGR